MKNKAKGGPGSGCHGPNCGRHSRTENYFERPAGRNPGKPRSGQRPSDLYPHGRNPDGSPRTANDPKTPGKP